MIFILYELNKMQIIIQNNNITDVKTGHRSFSSLSGGKYNNDIRQDWKSKHEMNQRRYVYSRQIGELRPLIILSTIENHTNSNQQPQL